MQRFQNILLVVEPDADNGTALNEAAMLAADNGAKLTIIDVVDRLPADLQMAITAVLPDELIKLVIAERREVISGLKASALQSGVPSVKSSVLTGRRFLEAIKAVQRDRHDLLIKAAVNQPGLLRVLSSTDMHILRKCPCPVWMVRAKSGMPQRRVLAAVDFEPEESDTAALNREIVSLASSLAAKYAADWHLVHAWRLPHERFLRSARSGLKAAEVNALALQERRKRSQWLQALLDEPAAADGGETAGAGRIQLREGDPKVEVPRAAKELEIDLVVMGTLGRVGIPGYFIGNTAEEILEQVGCSVLAIKPAGFVSPVHTED
ncbi:MAG: universal stress protein [Pseudomonadota bacterium]